MTRLKKTLLFWALVMFACSPDISTLQSSPENFPTDTPRPIPGTDLTLEIPLNSGTQVPLGPKIIVTVGTPHIDPGPDGEFPVTPQPSDACAFSWATSPLEELTDIFDAAIKEVSSDASARAVAFGEDCIHQDGSKKFLAIETDFYIDLPVIDLTDFETFGNWIAQSMAIVDSITPGMIEGPQSGFVEYTFLKNDNEILRVRVPIQTYKNSAQGKTGEELFRLFYSD